MRTYELTFTSVTFGKRGFFFLVLHSDQRFKEAENFVNLMNFRTCKHDLRKALAWTATTYVLYLRLMTKIISPTLSCSAM